MAEFYTAPKPPQWLAAVQVAAESKPLHPGRTGLLRRACAAAAARGSPELAHAALQATQDTLQTSGL